MNNFENQAVMNYPCYEQTYDIASPSPPLLGGRHPKENPKFLNNNAQNKIMNRKTFIKKEKSIDELTNSK